MVKNGSHAALAQERALCIPNRRSASQTPPQTVLLSTNSACALGGPTTGRREVKPSTPLPLAGTNQQAAEALASPSLWDRALVPTKISLGTPQSGTIMKIRGFPTPQSGTSPRRPPQEDPGGFPGAPGRNVSSYYTYGVDSLFFASGSSAPPFVGAQTTTC